MAPTIRPATKADEAALSNVCLLTADAGKSAKNLHSDPALPGLIYSLPYVNLESTWSFVLDDDGEVVGYVLGALSTRTFEESAETKWWPSLRARYGPMLHDPGVALTEIAFTPAHCTLIFLQAINARGGGEN